MKREVIAELIDSLPEESTLYIESGARRPMSGRSLMIYRRAKAEFDPGFPWAFVMDHIKRDAILPTCALQHDYLMDFYYFHQGIGTNEDLMEAMSWLESDYEPFRGLIEACLLNPRSSIEQTAELLHVPAPGLYYFERLLYSMRDRMDEPAFYNSLHIPGTVAVLEDTDGAEFARRWRRDDEASRGGGVDTDDEVGRPDQSGVSSNAARSSNHLTPHSPLVKST